MRNKMKPIISVLILFMLALTVIHAQDIITAATEGNREKIKELLAKNPELVKTKDENGRTPLHWASRGVHFEVLKYLVENKADVNAKDINKITPLVSAVSRNHFEAVKFLLDHNAKVQEEDNLQKAPILYALRGDTKLVLELLIKKGASLEVKNDYERTPLLLACREGGNFENVKLLVENGANINAKDRFGDTPLTFAAWRGFEEIVDYLLDKNAMFSTSGKEGIVLMSYALDKRLWKLYRALINKGGDSFLLSIMEHPVLHWAAAGGSEKIVGDLINRDMLVNAKDKYGWTPLHYASYFGRFEVVKMLIEKGSDINYKTPLGESPLYLAKAEGKKNICDYLVLAGADQKISDQTDLSGEYFGQKKYENSIELFAPGIISRLKGGHSNVVFSPDGTEAVWTEWNLRDVGYTDGDKIWYAKIKNRSWTFPKKILPKGDTPFYSVDGKRLYFMATLPLPPDNKEVKGIWYYELGKDSLTNPKYLDFDVSSNGLYWQFSFDKNNNIYFSGDEGLFRSLYNNGKYQQREKLSEIFHADYKGMGPYIAPDGSYIIFSSLELPDSFGKMDLYIGYKNSDGSWTKPINMGPKVNSPAQELLPIVSADGKYLFLRTERNSISGVHWIDANIIEELRPK